MMRQLMAGLMALMALPVMAAEPGPMKEGRKMVWSDEFNGSELDSTKWRFVRTMSANDVVYDNSSKYARLENSCLHLQVHASGNPSKPWALSEGVTTLQTMAFKYGYLEMRARVPFRHGAWPSFWMQSPKQFRTVDYLAEVDIFEAFSSANSLSSQIHKWGRGTHVSLPPEGGKPSKTYKFEDFAKLNDEFHIYAFEWNPREMKFYVDGTCYCTIQIGEEHDFGQDKIPGMKGFQDFQGVIFNNEIFTPGHGWCPEGFRLKPEDPMPIDYYIDWVRLWQDPATEQLKITK